MLCLFCLDSLSVVLQVHPISWVLLHVPFVNRLLLLFAFLTGRHILILRGITCFWLPSDILLADRFFLLVLITVITLMKLPVLHINSTILASIRNKLRLDLIFNLTFLFFH